MGPYADCLHPFEGQNLGWLLEMQATLRPDHPHLVFEPFDAPGQMLTYRQFLSASRRLARGMQRCGVRRGDRVIVHLDNSPEFLIAFCGCALLGAVAITTNTRSSVEELSYYIAKSRAVAAITQPAHADTVASAGRSLAWIAVTGNDCGVPAPAGGHDRFDDLLDEEELPGTGPAAALDPVCVQFTSGTTSRPKGVVWTHANALWAGRVSATHEALRPEDVHHCVLPLFHTNALSFSWLATLWTGGTMVLQPRFSSSRFWEVALRNRCSWASITGFCYKALANVPLPDRHHFRNWGVAFSDPLVAETFRIPSVSWWAMTETLSHGIVGYPHLPTPYGAVGKAAPEYTLRVLRDDGTQVTIGETGAIHIGGVRGVSLFLEYLDDPEATAAAFDGDGFFNTGDQATLLDNRFLKFADRRKDMLKVGGENVASSEIERVVNGVDGVAESAVIGRPHPLRDEVPVAFVRVHGRLAVAGDEAVAEEVLSACRATLADFKVPWEVHVVDEFPRANIGKIAKARLKAALLGGHDLRSVP
ncbi:AMP-binding protein [Mesorhizobium sp. 1B3]|uniref:AMP-binding protein n=1 Tax=Mesorhizobium sp. 1B3 TaxID=3243599 RepID=UPI003D985A2D